MGQKVTPTVSVSVSRRIGSRAGSRSALQGPRDRGLEDPRLPDQATRERAVSRIEIERNSDRIRVDITRLVRASSSASRRRAERLKKTREDHRSEEQDFAQHPRDQAAELDAALMPRICDQLLRRVAFRRAMKRGIQTSRSWRHGVKIQARVRLGALRCRVVSPTVKSRAAAHASRRHRLRLSQARTNTGRIGVKVWIYKATSCPTS